MDIAVALKRLTLDISRNKLIDSGDKLILGCSGGADSNAMLYMFSRLRHSLNVSLLAVHVNHQLRGEDSTADELAVKQLCQKLNVPLIIRRVDVPKSGNLESQARSLRFGAFEQVMKSYSFHKILLAHHRDDQAETVLLNLFRGAGVGGMAGIKPKAGKIIHPMLGFTHQELMDMLSAASVTWQHDDSNLDNGFTRNRLRNDLIPKLKEDYNNAITERLARQAEIFNQADKILLDRAKLQTKRIAMEYAPQRVVLEIPALQRLSDIEQYYILRQCFRLVSGVETDFMTVHFEAILDVLKSDGSKQLQLSHGVKLKKMYEELHLYTKEDSTAQSEEELEIDADRARAVYGDYRFTFKYLRVAPKDIFTDEGAIQVLIDADKINYPFKIRFRKPGDRFIPFGMKQFKRLKEFFIDEKVPKYDRELVPIMDDGEKLFWIVGHRIDDRVRYDDTTSHYLLIKAESTRIKPKRAANRKKTRGNDESDEL
ncbi:MAG: tRNA lysidine(34) synthetase TilS [Candidatus Cloacimonetes bacterium HGW-Cloacimonetes-3]|jgi:tRNA(Ile)-lysidine synthase|nr:MAG: tRNA lysidine(34) synthetase TilS [Candidatus Cloacimonetes bacterium HGW-Cloacimonetes-3]